MEPSGLSFTSVAQASLSSCVWKSRLTSSFKPQTAVNNTQMTVGGGQKEGGWDKRKRGRREGGGRLMRPGRSGGVVVRKRRRKEVPLVGLLQLYEKQRTNKRFIWAKPANQEAKQTIKADNQSRQSSGSSSHTLISSCWMNQPVKTLTTLNTDPNGATPTHSASGGLRWYYTRSDHRQQRLLRLAG